jgi:uncharacterized protein
MSLLADPKPMRTITLEEHFATPKFMEGPGRPLAERPRAAQAQSQAAPITEHLVAQLLNMDDLRIADMDAAGIDMQVLSLNSPGVEQLDASEAMTVAQETNDYLGAAVRRHPHRLAGFAALPTAAPDSAAAELERTVREYGFKGAVINGHTRGRYMDDPFFWPILERAEALQVPLYLHPTPPPQPVIQASYVGNFSPEVTSPAGGLSLGLAYRDGLTRPAHHSQRRVRPLPAASAGDRTPGRSAAIHAAQTRSQPAHSAHQTAAPVRRLLAREPALHLQRF